MNRQLTAEDTPKIALSVALLLALCGAGWFTVSKAGVERERERMGLHMDQEANLVAKEVTANRAENTEKDINDPEKALLLRP